jgi:imidazolonepropionase-like amidohydrolase
VQRRTLRAHAGTARSAIWQLRAQAADQGRPSDAGTVSNLNKKTYGQIKAWRNQPIDGEQPYVYLDGIVLKRTWAGEVRNVSLLVAITVNAEPISKHAAAQAAQRDDRLTGAGHRPKVRKILDTTVPSALGTSSSIQPKERLHWRTVVRKRYGFSPDLDRQ